MLGLPPVLGIVITLLVGALVGLFNGFLSITFGVNPFLVTLATLLIIRGLVVYLIPEGIYELPAGYTALGGERIGGTVPLAVVRPARADRRWPGPSCGTRRSAAT